MTRARMATLETIIPVDDFELLLVLPLKPNVLNAYQSTVRRAWNGYRLQEGRLRIERDSAAYSTAVLSR